MTLPFLPLSVKIYAIALQATSAKAIRQLFFDAPGTPHSLSG
ncbi:hypothetical protein [Microcoleus sp. FACHB-SPT15]|nr:hypothetical protein [Microcoleus sp. FACHB-SPT15]